MLNLEKLSTEARNPASSRIDKLDTLSMMRVMNDEDQKTALAVKAILPDIARAVDVIAARLKTGGRLFYMGSGTSGRLGILDAVECPPTYSTDPDLVQGLIAGGKEAIFRGSECNCASHGVGKLYYSSYSGTSGKIQRKRCGICNLFPGGAYIDGQCGAEAGQHG